MLILIIVPCSLHRFSRTGFPATLSRMEMPATNKSDPPARLTFLLIYVPKHAAVYTLVGFSEDSNSDSLDREIEGIGDSFHVEQANVPSFIKN